MDGTAAALTLAGCGGGGGDDGNAGAPASTAPVTNPAPVTTPTTTATAEGVYQGTVSNGLTQFSLVLENGDLYVLYGKPVNTVFGVSGFLRGSGKSSNGAFTATDVREYAPAVSSTTFSFNGTYSAGASLNGTVTGGATSTTYTGTPVPSANYTYNTAAKVADVAGAWTLNDLAGAWTLNDLTGATVRLNVGADGKFTGTSGGCAVTGSLAPRASGKNVFDFTLLFGGAPCALPNQTASGAALYFTIGTQHQLIAAGTDAARQNGTAIIGAR